MQMHEAGEVVQVIGALNANAKLAEGWTLLAVVSGEVSKAETASAVYVLGRKKKEMPKLPTAADMERANAGL